ncbi:PIN domain-like protein [Lactarius hengduanensis]|nr:PIN domain-like protein [Lactarius hengduanensis]
MGVLGLTPFLQKACPHVITQLPNRFKSLSNKTVVIDGTLVTQRFHFAPMPHEYRHILGWYRLIQEFREHGIRAICVFDGEERTTAKSSEQSRRRNIRRTDAFRGEIELDRLRRLLDMTKDLNALRLLDKDERLHIVTSLREHMSNFEGDLVLKPLDLASQSSPISRSSRSCLLDADPALSPGEFSHLEDADLEDLFHENCLSVNTNAVAPQDIDLMFASQCSAGTEELDFHHIGQLPPSFGVIDQSEGGYDLGDRLSFPDIELPEAYQEAEKWQGLASSLTDLYMDYRRGMAKVEVIPSAVTSATPPVVDSQELVEPADVQTEPTAISSLVHGTSRASLGSVDLTDTQVAHAAMSKTQYQLTVEEGKLWEKLTDPEGASDHEESPTETILASLREKSCFMVESLLRRSSPPTEITYEESKSVLHAMGVPCIDTTGPYEAEALASSLVLNGSADYVASEDTDVLVYGAPLLRNITSKEKPLLLISGSEVRSALRLDAPTFVDFALLLGTDFAPRIRNIGPHRALQFIREYGTIERILREEKRYVPRARVPLRPYLRAVRDARDVFVNLPPVPTSQMLEPKEYREGEVAALLEFHRLQRFLEPDTLLGSLEGNYFNDNPTVTI